MDEDRDETTRRLFHLALEIVSLLSGEDYTIVRKTPGDGVTPIIHLQESGGRSPGPITEPPPHSLLHERNKKILELSNKMIELLSGEVPIRCQDVAVYLSMEEWEYLEGHQDRYQDDIMEELRPLTPRDGSRRRCPRPLYPQDCPEENHNIPEEHQGEDLIDIKVEVIDDAEEMMDVWAGQQNGSRRRNPPERCPRPLYPQSCPEENHYIPEDHQGENPIDLKIEIIHEAQEAIALWADQQDGSRRRNPPERCPRPLCSPDCPEENHNIPEDHQNEDLANCKVEMETEEEQRLRGHEAFTSDVKEEIPVDPPPDNMSSKRKSYSVEYKKRIVEDSRGKNLTAFCKEKMLNIRMVRRWRAAYDNLSQQVCKGNAKRRKCGAGRHPLFPELEDMICEWIADRRAKALVVRRADIQEFALTMAPQLEISPEDFKASHHWLDGFLQRCELSLRRSTALCKLEDAEVIKRALAFKSFVDGIDFSKYQLSNMIVMDETAVFMGQGSQTTIDQRVPPLSMCSTGHESARVTCILAIRLDGTKVPPLIITKGKKEKMKRISGIYILETVKAWCTQAVIRKWVDLMLPLVLRGSQRGLLVWDSASTHRAKDMKNFLHERKIDQIVIPAGMTAYLQTLDIAINKPFKDHLRTEMNDYIKNRMQRKHGNFVKPRLQEVVTWVKNSWEKITDSCVANALQAGYMDKRRSFKESAIAGHEKLGPMILKATESQEIDDWIQGLESYDDVPEDDDMTVFE
ncbi:uncharacterized protein LOC143793513 isoform X2 [Ranitomeya variabilis]|uniref:uncharacterized protein LOC143793513 isoform X2 n=1 Tax=Ranitomeya variabilis TaxID=490064 RepID=UPI00405731E9